MNTLRRLTAPLAVLLSLVVGGEMTDVIPCVDDECGVWSALLTDAGPEDGSGSDVPGEGEPLAACICHVTFAPTAGPVALAAPAEAAPAQLAVIPERPTDAERAVPYPPPRD